MSTVIDAKSITDYYKKKISSFVKKRLEDDKSEVTMSIIQAGDDGGSTYYRNAVKKVATNLGIKVVEKVFDIEISEEKLLEEINSINKDTKIHGILLLMPLPKHLDEEKISNAIEPKKDIDGVTLLNSGKLYKGSKCFIPCTPEAVITILKSININLEGKEAVIIGRSDVVGKPLMHLLLKENATVTICHSRTKDLKAVTKRADILISAIGKPRFITKDFIKEDAIVIDVGTTIVDGKITGDIDFEEALKTSSYITKVPGGVGSVTTTMLLLNLIMACENND